jgi:hypothetical protein
MPSKQPLAWLPAATILAALISFSVLAFPHLNQKTASDFSFVWLSVGAVLILGLHVWAANLDPIEHMVSEYSDVLHCRIDAQFGVLDPSVHGQ